MKYIKPLFSRLLIGLIGAGMLNEALRLALVGQKGELPGFFFAVIFVLLFVLMSAYVSWEQYKYYFFPPKSKDTDILDDDI